MKIDIYVKYIQQRHMTTNSWEWTGNICDALDINDIDSTSSDQKQKLIEKVIQYSKDNSIFESSKSANPTPVKDSILGEKEITPYVILSNWNYYRRDLNDEETINEYLNNVCWLKPKMPNEIYSIKFFRSFTATMPHDNNPEEVLTIIVKFS